MKDLDLGFVSGHVRQRRWKRARLDAPDVNPDIVPSCSDSWRDDGDQVGENDSAAKSRGGNGRCAVCLEGHREGSTKELQEAEPAKPFVLERTEDMTSEAIIAAALAAAPNQAIFRHPLFRRIYLTAVILVSLLVLVPVWSLWYAYRPNRPRKSWTVQRCLRVRWSRLLCGLVARCEIDYLGRDLTAEMLPESLKHSHPIRIPAAHQDYLRGHPREMLDELHQSRGRWIPRMIHRQDSSLRAAWGRWNVQEEIEKEYGFEDVVGFWFTGEKASPDEGPKPIQPGDPVGLHFHGGGYLCGTAAETDLTSSIPKTLVGHSPIHHILSIDYRLAPTAPWPLPLLDAISAYIYLVSPTPAGGAGVPARDIIIFGDSAGGHLGLALVRWLRDEGKQLGLKMPRGVVLMSPWVDVGFTTAWGAGKDFNKDSDTIDDTFGPFASSLLFRAIPGVVMHQSAYLSPGGLLVEGEGARHGPVDGKEAAYADGSESTQGMFTDYPPTFVVYGGAERLGPSIRLFYDRLCRDSTQSDSSPPVENESECDSTPAGIADISIAEPLGFKSSSSLPCIDCNGDRRAYSPPDHPHRILVGPDAVHDFLIFPWMGAEAAVVYKELDVWLRQLLGSDDLASDSDSDSGIDLIISNVTPYEPIHPPPDTKAHLVPATPSGLPTPTAFVLDEPTSPPTPFFRPTQLGLGRRMSSVATARGKNNTEERARAQQHRRNSRRSILVDRSPVIEPQKVGMRGMVHDMRAEAMTYLSLDGEGSGMSGRHGIGEDGASRLMGEERKEGWLAHQLDRLTPFTAQLEKGEWDWEVGEGGEDGQGGGWYEASEDEEG